MYILYMFQVTELMTLLHGCLHEICFLRCRLESVIRRTLIIKAKGFVSSPGCAHFHTVGKITISMNYLSISLIVLK